MDAFYITPKMQMEMVHLSRKIKRTHANQSIIQNRRPTYKNSQNSLFIILSLGSPWLGIFLSVIKPLDRVLSPSPFLDVLLTQNSSTNRCVSSRTRGTTRMSSAIFLSGRWVLLLIFRVWGLYDLSLPSYLS